MIVHQIYAEIYEEKVMNIIVCEDYATADWLAKQTYGSNAFAVDCQQYPCQIGDTFMESTFYHADVETGEETIVPCMPTQEAQLTILQGKNEVLYKELVTTQMALTEIYELMEG